jgi:hypothetical protein
VVEAFKRQHWDEAIERCREYLKRGGEDGPTALYLKACEEIKENPAEEPRDGVIHV